MKSWVEDEGAAPQNLERGGNLSLKKMKIGDLLKVEVAAGDIVRDQEEVLEKMI